MPRDGGLPQQLRRAVERDLGVLVTSVEPCPGGDINRAWRLELADGRRAFLKSRPDAPRGEYSREASGLSWLAAAGGLPAPAPLAVLEEGPWRGLLLEWVEAAGVLSGRSWEELGRGLALTHRAGGGAPGGMPPDTDADGIRFGPATIPPAPVAAEDFTEVYSQRIESLGEQAFRAGAIDSQGLRSLGRLAHGLARFCGPPEPPARLHGDLWAGNVLADGEGRPWLIDPAAHGGHRELDLAMLELFASPPPSFYAAYEEVWPLSPGRQERIRLWQVQPLLVHAVLFGGGYGDSAVAAARAFNG
jgi:fructosamine-3-kinase